MLFVYFMFKNLTLFLNNYILYLSCVQKQYYIFKQRRIIYGKGLLIISSVNNIGSNKNDVFKELTWLKDHHIETIFADYPATQIFDNPMANELALNVIIDVYASLLDNKTFDIRSTMAAPTGRKKISFPSNWESLYALWDNGEISAKEFMEKSGLKKGTFYHLVNEYRELLLFPSYISILLYHLYVTLLHILHSPILPHSVRSPMNNMHLLYMSLLSAFLLPLV